MGDAKHPPGTAVMVTKRDGSKYPARYIGPLPRGWHEVWPVWTSGDTRRRVRWSALRVRPDDAGETLRALLRQRIEEDE